MSSQIQAATKPKTTLADVLESRRDAIAAVLPKHVTAEKLLKIALVAVSKNNLLAQCTHLSIAQCVMTAAQLGLDCGGALGSAYLVPFRKGIKRPDGNWDNHYEATLIIGYRGMIDLARRSGEIKSIESRVVYVKDKFEMEFGLTPKLYHVPYTEGEPGALRLVYAVAHLKDGGVQYEVMTKTEIDGIRARSKSGKDGPWVTDYNEMARKTVIRRLFKYLPVSVEILQATHEDTEREFGTTAIDQIQPDTGAAALNKRLPQLGDLSGDDGNDGGGETVDTNTGEVIEGEKIGDTEDVGGHGEVPAATNAILNEAASDFGKFSTAMIALSIDRKQDQGAVKSMIDNLKLKTDCGNDRAKGRSARLAVLQAAHTDKLDWNTGEILN